MIKINIYLRFAIIALCLVVGTILSIFVSFWYALPLFLVAVGLFVGYVLLGTVPSAAELVQVQQIDAASERLDLTKFPNLLLKPIRANYHMIRGMIAQVRKDSDLAEQHLLTADALDVGDNERAMIKLQLASIAGQRNNVNKAKGLIRETKTLNITEAAIREQVAQFEAQLKQYGAARSQQMQHGRRGGLQAGKSKRRRPKMR